MDDFLSESWEPAGCPGEDSPGLHFQLCYFPSSLTIDKLVTLGCWFPVCNYAFLSLTGTLSFLWLPGSSQYKELSSPWPALTAPLLKILGPWLIRPRSSTWNQTWGYLTWLTRGGWKLEQNEGSFTPPVKGRRAWMLWALRSDSAVKRKVIERTGILWDEGRPDFRVVLDVGGWWTPGKWIWAWSQGTRCLLLRLFDIDLRCWFYREGLWQQCAGLTGWEERWG